MGADGASKNWGKGNEKGSKAWQIAEAKRTGRSVNLGGGWVRRPDGRTRRRGQGGAGGKGAKGAPAAPAPTVVMPPPWARRDAPSASSAFRG